MTYFSVHMHFKSLISWDESLILRDKILILREGGNLYFEQYCYRTKLMLKRNL